MENKNETKYFFIWLYISLLLHLFMVVIMLTIKPSSSQLQEPDPAFQQIDPATIIFVTDEPIKQPDPVDDNNEVQPYQMSKKTQGSESGNTDDERAPSEEYAKSSKNNAQDDIDNTAKNTHLDTSNKALTDEFKKGLKDETTVKDQSLADDSVQEKASAVQASQQLDAPTQAPQISDIEVKTFDEKIESEKIIAAAEKQEKKFDAIEEFNRLMQKSSYAKACADAATDKHENAQAQKQQELSAIIPSKNASAETIQKIESKKHRPIDIGLQNQSKLELTRDVSEYQAPKKRKLSLQDLNLGQGFSEFVRKGNADFSADGNSDYDNEMGLKRKSYMTQISKTHTNAFNSYPEKLIIKHQDQIPSHDSIINMIIDRTGKINLVRLQSSGNQFYDDYHMKVLIFMGDFPRIPKYIEASFPIKSVFYTPTNSSAYGSYQPGKLQL